MRRDAARKREQVVTAAGDELAELTQAARDGEAVRLSLDKIAARAGVGIATLYRHFPTREALLEAVYRQELARVCDAAPALAEAGPPDAALLTWMQHYLDFVDSKRVMGDDLRALVASGTITQTDTRARLADAAQYLLAAGVTAGTFRDDVTPDDLVAGMAGAAIAAAPDRQREQSQRLITLLVDGLRVHRAAGQDVVDPARPT
ncbi:TetR family transcriptional regulator [Kribbella amoyensis]|uniref:TetR family transcriptional regulator n=1 Tax=Kribbella amoyensis TaxID=996641 RepID=A0A561BWK9_9ACTN|nr:TetR/AcrR family transcriptional regulator [Kribbella amoyensis]TWD83208.1 TetR family transcriptional regulator [Kribbella amoyensis]